MSEIKLNNLHKSFGDFVAVRNTNLTIGNGRFVVLLGPSGCGKTTTLRMIAGLELPTSGQILLDHRDVTWQRARERDIAFVFQLFALYPHMTVRENIAFPLRNERLPRKQIIARVASTARLLRIEELVRVAEQEASCELYGLLKRPDEKYVTERAYDNPKFVEDLVRDVATALNRDKRIDGYIVESENFESIHNHSAYALIEKNGNRSA